MATNGRGHVRSEAPRPETTRFLARGDTEAQAEFVRAVAFANLDLRDDFAFELLRRERPQHTRVGYKVKESAHGGWVVAPEYRLSPATVAAGHRVCACEVFVDEIALALRAMVPDLASVRAALNPRRRRRSGSPSRATNNDRPGVGYAALNVARALRGTRTNRSVVEAQLLIRNVLDALIDGDAAALEDATRRMTLSVRVHTLDLSRGDPGARSFARRDTARHGALSTSAIWLTFQPAAGAESLLFGIVLAARTELLRRLFRCRQCRRYAVAGDDRGNRLYCARGECRTAKARGQRRVSKGDPARLRRNRDDQARLRRRRKAWARQVEDDGLVKQAIRQLRNAPRGEEAAAAKALARAIASAERCLRKSFPWAKSTGRFQGEKFIADARALLARYDSR